MNREQRIRLSDAEQAIKRIEKAIDESKHDVVGRCGFCGRAVVGGRDGYEGRDWKVGNATCSRCGATPARLPMVDRRLCDRRTPPLAGDRRKR